MFDQADSEEFPEDEFRIKSPIDEDFEFALDQFSYSRKLWHYTTSGTKFVIHNATNRLELSGFINKNVEGNTLVIPEDFLKCLTSTERKFYFSTKLREFHNPDTAGCLISLFMVSGVASGLWSFVYAAISTLNMLTEEVKNDWQPVFNHALASISIILISGKTMVDERYFDHDQKSLEAIGVENLNSAVSCLKKMYKWIDSVQPDNFSTKESFIPPGEHARSYKLLKHAQKVFKESSQSANLIQ